MKDWFVAQSECQRNFPRAKSRVEIQKDEEGLLIVSGRDRRIGNMRGKSPRSEYA